MSTLVKTTLLAYFRPAHTLQIMSSSLALYRFTCYSYTFSTHCAQYALSHCLSLSGRSKYDFVVNLHTIRVFAQVANKQFFEN